MAWRRLRLRSNVRLGVPAFAGIGAAFSFLSGLLGRVGPLMAPFSLADGLVKGAYIGTEAAATVVMHLTKLVAYSGTAVLTSEGVLVGLALGPSMVLGSLLGKRIVERLSPTVFVLVIEATLLLAGIALLLNA